VYFLKDIEVIAIDSFNKLDPPISFHVMPSFKKMMKEIIPFNTFTLNLNV